MDVLHVVVQIIRASSTGDLVMAANHKVGGFKQATKNLKQFTQ
jgi:ribosomal protein L18